ncbi:MAG TPA: hypothetical protein VIA62_23545 [Thermoanaerobaculia bacterium]|jgi:hypothetical protein|nr:hypothetical protein [Thermoanaerobaculia bacterium]
MAILRQDDTREALRRQLVEEAVEYRRRHTLRLAGLPRREVINGTPDELVETSWNHGIISERNDMLLKAKGDFSTLTPDGRAVVDTNRLIRSPEVVRTLAVLERKIQTSRFSGKQAVQNEK